MRLPLGAKCVIVAAFLGGLATLVSGAVSLAHHPIATNDAAIELGVFTALVVASWLWPLVMYRGKESEAHHLDEGFFVIMALVLPPGGVILAFALSTVLAQWVLRRPLIKSIFNSGQILMAVGLGVWTVNALAPFHGPLKVPDVLGAVVGTIVFTLVNAASLAAILIATGSDVRHAIFDGIEIRMLLVGAALSIGLVTALAISTYPVWALPIAVIPLLVLRQVLAGHFGARQDRARLHGLFQATLEANHSMGSHDVEEVILRSATDLLRCARAALEDSPIDEGLNVPVPSGEQTRWLTVSGRSRTEPFDDADRALLEALGAVGAGALANAGLYEEVRYQRERLAAITASLGEGVCALDRAGRVMFVNPAAEQMLGWSEDELRSISPDGAAPWTQHPLDFLVGPAVRAVQNRTSIRSEDALFLKRGGGSFPVAFTASPIVDNGEVAGAVVAFRDITERRAFEEQLTQHAFHDALTALPNRRLFLDHLDRALARQARSTETHAVLFADVDRFKVINDSLGHHAGDALLVAIAERMTKAVRPGDVLARFGGDEFTLLLTDITSAADAVCVAERITDLLRGPVALGEGHEVVPTVSIGIALTSEGKSRDDILHDADVAMYKAKVRGRSGYYEVFDSAAMGARSAERLDLETALRRALDDRTELEVYYQPLVSTRRGGIIGMEALVRWNHPQRGLLLPGQFIELAEDTGLILPLGRFVLEQACRQVQEWTETFGTKLSMSVNLSARQFQQQSLLDDVETILRATRVRPSQICLEITETLAMVDVDRTISVLHRLKALGVRLAIDDFGTGYSSLGYLKRFPIDVVKIDRSFVEGLQTNAVDSAIVAAVINLTEAIGMTTVAEGIETPEQLEHLRSLRCPVVQGFLLARPMPAGAMAEMLQRSTGTPLLGLSLASAPA